MCKSVIRICDLTKYYGDLLVVDHISYGGKARRLDFLFFSDIICIVVRL